MKKLLIAAVILLTACSKTKTELQESKTTYYRLQEVSKDGHVEFSPIRTANIDAATAGDNNPPHCPHTPVAIIVESFVIVKQKDNSIKIYWRATNEDVVSYYVIEKSSDSKNWIERERIVPNMTGNYIYTDK